MTNTYFITGNGKMIETTDRTYRVSNFTTRIFKKPTGETFTVSGGTLKNLSRNRKRDRIMRHAIGWKKWKQAVRRNPVYKEVL